MLSGKQIAEARKRKGLTQEALAAELGVSRQTIAKWEQEISTPSVTNAHRLIDILGLQEMENKSSAEDEGNARTICKKRLTKRLLIELWAVYVGIAFLCFFFYWNCGIVFYPCNIGCPNISCYCSAGSKGKEDRFTDEDSSRRNMLYWACHTGSSCYTCKWVCSKRKLST